jgi:hypothetical protein
VSVATCAIRPELQLVSPQLCKPPGKNYWVLDFDALPVGERTTRELVLQNTGGQGGMPMTQHYSTSALCPPTRRKPVRRIHNLVGRG